MILQQLQATPIYWGYILYAPIPVPAPTLGRGFTYSPPEHSLSRWSVSLGGATWARAWRGCVVLRSAATTAWCAGVPTGDPGRAAPARWRGRGSAGWPGRWAGAGGRRSRSAARPCWGRASGWAGVGGACDGGAGGGAPAGSVSGGSRPGRPPWRSCCGGVAGGRGARAGRSAGSCPGSSGGRPRRCTRRLQAFACSHLKCSE